MWWNPWKRIRELEERLAYVENECRYLERFADEAMGRACEHFNRRYQHETARNNALQENLSMMVSMNPSVFTVPK